MIDKFIIDINHMQKDCCIKKVKQSEEIFIYLYLAS